MQSAFCCLTTLCFGNHAQKSLSGLSWLPWTSSTCYTLLQEMPYHRPQVEVSHSFVHKQLQGEKVCEDDESSGSTFCSVEGLCVALSEAEEVDLNAERYPPVISLNGLEEVVQIDAGTPYDICPLDGPAQCALFQGSSGAGSGSVTSASGQEDSEDEDLAPAPWIGLRDVPGIEQSGAIIRIPEGLSFIGCNEDGAAEICEPGADAKDETGDVRERVWACPESPLMPANCLTNPSACPFDEYGFEAAGLRYCQIDVPDGQDGFVAGDSFEIRFVILAHNGRVSEARRFVTFTRRCPSDDQPFYCNAPELGKPEYQCVALECEQWRAIGAPETNGEMGAPVFSSSLAASPSDNLVSLAGGAGRRLLQERHLLQQGSGKEEVPVETVTTELAYFYEAGSVPDGLYWKNRPLAPCQPESGPESACDIAAFDARGASVRISAAPVCTDQFSAYPSYEEFLAAVKSSAALEAATDELCQAKLCSPSSADRGQCRPGKYIIQYEASDTGERRSIMNLVFRVENGARHIVQVIGAVLCGLKQMVSKA
ncbi:hypothetical protein DUNSADRAFT_12161 [Dunaliella salina]|uniref:Uncharacterized protein n=1 Tax=Dunaliella salina TaxID=3046 RepID=A0ABQ7GBU3_DUNSA|nr:hypothetical protein DUNSADRAFT_12161 [Dunaliella salina]|eukprot:KAF5832087.1 hypothetical protein DUNSADRAFT_12161 [Dunaliella salina]